LRIFLAGAGGAIGRRLTPLLRAAGHLVVGTTRTPDKAAAIVALGAEPVVVDVFDAEALGRAMKAAAPDLVMHQLTDLPFAPDTSRYEEGLARNARLRVDGSANLVAAAKAAGVRRMIGQSIAFAYAPGPLPHAESDAVSGGAVIALEQAVLSMPEGVVLRYGLLYGPGTWYAAPARPPSVHVDAAAQAAVLAVSRGTPGVYNVTDDDGYCATGKARRDLGFDPRFRVNP
jgi:nucleoside-diphosphate-sugar epimerase